MFDYTDPHAGLNLTPARPYTFALDDCSCAGGGDSERCPVHSGWAAEFDQMAAEYNRGL